VGRGCCETVDVALGKSTNSSRVLHFGHMDLRKIRVLFRYRRKEMFSYLV
jgi:hypothetical protein